MAERALPVLVTNHVTLVAPLPLPVVPLPVCKRPSKQLLLTALTVILCRNPLLLIQLLTLSMSRQLLEHLMLQLLPGHP